MATNYPIVRLKREASPGKRIKGRKPFFPSQINYQTQSDRFGATFDKAASTISQWETGVDISSDPRAVVPERALVFELIGPVSEFNIAVEAIGLEWLKSDTSNKTIEGIEEGDNSEDDGGQKNVLYLTMPSLNGLNKLLAMWRRYNKGSAPTSEEKPFWKIFGYLNDLRAWSTQDRIESSLSRYIHALLTEDPTRPVNIELDFWYRSEAERRNKSISTLRQLIDEVKGTLLDVVDIPEILYQGALITVPAEIARQLSQQDGAISRFDDIMTIRPQSEYSKFEEETSAGLVPVFEEVTLSRKCITLLLDGYPVSNHQALEGRLQIHEVEVFSTEVPVSNRMHGTSMASLILNGDLNASKQTPLTRPIAVIPVLTKSARYQQEATPPNKLAIGVIYRALLALIAIGKTNDDFKDITIINHALCDTNAPFVRRPTPWGMLLDYFSHRHRLLFVISAGNILSSFPVRDFVNLEEFELADPALREAAILNAIEQVKATRGILSPAESINSLTVGALHAEESTGSPANSIDPYPTVAMTNLASGLGFGINRSMKPELVEEGGRFAVKCSNDDAGFVNIHPHSPPDLGHLVAAPSATGNLSQTMRSAGTSNASAIVTRSCNQIADALEDAFSIDGVDWLSLPTRVPILKALITHGCSWGETGNILEASYPPQGKHQWSKRRDTISKFIGYGRPELDRVLSGADNRITLLADDEILPEELHEYRIPLPSGMLNTRDLRSITITLAWTTKIVTTTVDYRGVALKIVDSAGKRDYWEGVDRVVQPNGFTSERGTITHFVLEGSKLKKLEHSGGLFFGVQARATHSSVQNEKTPYAMTITLEMAQTQKSNVYAEVSAVVRARTAVRTPTRIGTR